MAFVSILILRSNTAGSMKFVKAQTKILVIDKPHLKIFIFRRYNLYVVHYHFTSMYTPFLPQNFVDEKTVF